MKIQKFYSLWLSLIIILVFILQIFIQGFTDLFMLSENALYMPWQFITAIFLHGSLLHLVYNLFALIIFGLILEKLIGSNKFLMLFFISGILANIISFWFYPNALGASGAIMAIIGTLSIIRPLMAVWAFGMILPMFLVALLWIIGSVLGIFGFGDQGTGHLVHLIGLFFGVLYGFYLKLRARKVKEIIYQRKIIIPEGYMRNWENYYLKR